ncbi:MAG: hypothetical protein ACI9KE_002267 [Polyangiales bacterium]|jgi:hypothetical protein
MKRQSLNLRQRWDVYEAVVALAWADTKLTVSEVRAARTVALELDLLGPFSHAGEMLRDKRTQLPEGSPPDEATSRESEKAASAIYASAAWIAQVDGYLHRRESIALANLRRRLRIDATRAKHLDQIAGARGTSPTRPVYREMLEDCFKTSSATLS